MTDLLQMVVAVANRRYGMDIAMRDAGCPAGFIPQLVFVEWTAVRRSYGPKWEAHVATDAAKNYGSDEGWS
jgi:hypothetical protein